MVWFPDFFGKIPDFCGIDVADRPGGGTVAWTNTRAGRSIYMDRLGVSSMEAPIGCLAKSAPG